jgi:hypothetical protein
MNTMLIPSVYDIAIPTSAELKLHNIVVQAGTKKTKYKYDCQRTHILNAITYAFASLGTLHSFFT